MLLNPADAVVEAAEGVAKATVAVIVRWVAAASMMAVAAVVAVMVAGSLEVVGLFEAVGLFEVVAR